MSRHLFESPTRSDLLVINKTDLAPMVRADLGVMARDAERMRGIHPYVFTNLKERDGVAAVASFIVATGGLPPPTTRDPARRGTHIEA